MKEEGREGTQRLSAFQTRVWLRKDLSRRREKQLVYSKTAREASSISSTQMKADDDRLLLQMRGRDCGRGDG